MTAIGDDAQVLVAIPKTMREPWLGDIREDRQELAACGMPHCR